MGNEREIRYRGRVSFHLLSIEAFISYYVFSGLIKWVLDYYELSLPVDLTILFMGIIVLMLLIEWLKPKGFPPTSNETVLLTAFFLIFYVYAAISLLYTPSTHFAFEKVLRLATNFIFILILLRGRLDIQRFLRISFVLVLLLIAWYLPLRFLYITEQSPKGYLFTRDIIGMYLSLAMSLGLILLVFLTSEFKLSKHKLFNQVFYSIGFIALLLLGARGPILFFLFVYFIFLILKGKVRVSIKRNTLAIAILTCLILAVTIFIFREQFVRLASFTIERFQQILGGLGSNKNDYGNSVNERLIFFRQSKEIILHSFSNFMFGAGIGSFGILTTGEDIRQYPHNFILEIWCELGLTGLAIFFTLIFLSLRNLRFSTSSFNVFPVLYILLSFMKSGGMEDMRLLFTFLAIYYIAPKNMPGTLNLKR